MSTCFRYVRSTSPAASDRLDELLAEANASKDAFFAEWAPVIGIDGQTDTYVWRVLVPAGTELPVWLRKPRCQEYEISKRGEMLAHPNKRDPKGAALVRAIDEVAKRPRPLQSLASECGFNTFVFADDHSRTAWIGGNRVGGKVWLGIPFSSPEKAAQFIAPIGWRAIEEWEYRIGVKGES
jgi:hypothetical protein